MNKALPTLLLGFALALCGLCTYQWLREGRLYRQVASLNDDVYRKKESIQTLEADVKQRSAEIARLEGVRNELNLTVQTNRQEILSLTKAVDKLEKEVETLKHQISEYHDAMNTANARIKKQNEDIVRQNDMLKTLAQQRDDKVKELAKLAGDYNKLVTDYNKLQEEAAKLAAEAASQEKKQSK